MPGTWPSFCLLRWSITSLSWSWAWPSDLLWLVEYHQMWEKGSKRCCTAGHILLQFHQFQSLHKLRLTCDPGRRMGNTVSLATLLTRRPQTLQWYSHMPVECVLFCFKVFCLWCFVCVCALHVCSSHKGQKGALEAFKLVLQTTVSCHGNLGPPQEQPMLLIAEPPLKTWGSLFQLSGEITLAITHWHKLSVRFPLTTKIGKTQKNVGYFAKNIKITEPGLSVSCLYS